MITLGIDTSNYTTSIALTDSNGELVLDLRKPLIVKKNSIGLRQSDAFYQHMKQLNEMLEIVKPYHNSIKNIVVPLNREMLINRICLSLMQVFFLLKH